MPFLDWVNKNQAVSSAANVPYHLLQLEKTYGDAQAAQKNLIIQGDNLQALKALLPFYTGKVKCIYIDPPFNTEQAFEFYDDKLEHSQWLSMIYPRLVLLRELLSEDGSAFVHIDDNELGYKHIDAAQLAFDAMSTSITENELVEWLDRKTRRSGLTQIKLRAYLLKMIAHLLHDRKFSLTALVRAQFQLARAINDEIDRLYVLAREKAFQGDLFGKMSVAPIADQFNQFEFKPGIYPVRKPYRGSYEFQKHFYAQIDDLREKTNSGKISEEFLCAQAIDLNPNVKYWVRNIPQQRQHSFWLPTSDDYFYPDFVVELNNGAIVLIEYKGEPYKTNDDSREKNDIGAQWAKDSLGMRRYLMAVSIDDCGRSVATQIESLLAL